MSTSFSANPVTSNNGSSTLNINAGTAAAGTYTLTITGTAGSTTHNATLSVTVTVPTANDFSVSVNPTSISMAQAGSGQATINTATTSGSSQKVVLSVSGAPQGMSTAIATSPVTSGGSATLTVSAGTAAAGNYTLTITGTATSGTRTATLGVSVTAPTSDDFSISASPSSLSIAQGGSDHSTISTATISGSAQTVTLSVTGAPSGVTATVSPSPISSGQTATLNIAVDSSAAAGTYTLVVTGAGSVKHSANVALTVTQSGGTCNSQSNLIGNGGFESGSAAPWALSAGVLNPGTGEIPHSGSWNAWLDGYGVTHTDAAYQTITIPSGACSATLSFWLHIDTSERTTVFAYDTLKVQVRNSSNAVLATLHTYSNLDAAGGYAQHSFDLSAYAGQTIRVYFLGHEDFSLQTSFVLDDVAVNVTQ
jgi:uncharacterized membrane protein